MRVRAILLALTLGACAQAPARTGGIVSTNMCADAILVRLVTPQRIAAISHYSQDPDVSTLPLSLANRFRVTAGTAEEVIALRPSLVLTDRLAPATTLAAYRRAGLRTLVLDSPVSIAADVAQVRRIAAAVGAKAAGEVMAREIDQSATPTAVGPSAILYIAGDMATGRGNLLDEMMTRAGLRNAAADYGLSFTGVLPAETLVARPPMVAISTGPSRSAALQRRLLPETKDAAFPPALVYCGGPSIPRAMARLRAIRASL